MGSVPTARPTTTSGATTNTNTETDTAKTTNNSNANRNKLKAHAMRLLRPDIIRFPKLKQPRGTSYRPRIGKIEILQVQQVSRTLLPVATASADALSKPHLQVSTSAKLFAQLSIDEKVVRRFCLKEQRATKAVPVGRIVSGKIVRKQGTAIKTTPRIISKTHSVRMQMTPTGPKHVGCTDCSVVPVWVQKFNL